MTFAIALANADQIIQVSDRRLTLGGCLVEDSANKAGHALCDDASLLYCFTGLARVGNSHITSRWLVETLYDAAQRHHGYRDLIDSFAEEASKSFRNSPYIGRLTPNARRLTVMLTGYTADNFIVNSLISNFQDFTKFIDHPEAQRIFTVYAERSIRPASENPTVIQAVGQFHALTRSWTHKLGSIV